MSRPTSPAPMMMTHLCSWLEGSTLRLIRLLQQPSVSFRWRQLSIILVPLGNHGFLRYSRAILINLRQKIVMQGLHRVVVLV